MGALAKKSRNFDSFLLLAVIGFPLSMIVAEFLYTEQSDDEIDLVSNGFKIRLSNQETGHNGHRYAYFAIGQTLVGSNNVPATAR